MIYRALLSLVAVFAALSSMAQPPDYKAIADSISTPSSRYYYPYLMNRYRAMDTTLTAEDYRYLYYGYPESEDYKPLLANSYVDSLNMTFGTRATPSYATYQRVVFLCRTILEQEPFNVRDLNVLAFAHAQTGDTIQAKKVMRQVEMLLETIKSTGDGLSEKTPWYIIYRAQAEDLMNVLGAQFRQPIVVSRTVEFYPVDNMANKRKKGYYFNFESIYARRPDYLEDSDVVKPKRKLEVNPFLDPRNSKLNDKNKK